MHTYTVGAASSGKAQVKGVSMVARLQERRPTYDEQQRGCTCEGRWQGSGSISGSNLHDSNGRPAQLRTEKKMYSISFLFY
jgi:hypothetical protein